MASEQAVGNANLIREHHSEGQTHQPRSQPQPLRKSLVSFSEEIEGGGDAHRNQHHSSNGACSEDEQVSDRPVRIPNGCENQQSHGGGTGESMNYSDYQRTKLLIETDLAKRSIEPGQRRLVAVEMRVRIVSMGMAVDVVPMAVGMPMNKFRILG